MGHYEVVLMINPNCFDVIDHMIKQYKDFITNKSGIIHRLEDWGNRPLAYPIKKMHKAHYILLNMEISQNVIQELKSVFESNSNVMRILIIKVKRAIIEVSPVMKIKSEHS